GGLPEMYIFRMDMNLVPYASVNNVVLHNVGPGNYEMALRMKVTSTNDLIIAGENGKVNIGADALAVKIKAETLTPLWSVSTNRPALDENFRDVTELTDGNLVFTGMYAEAPFKEDQFISKIKGDGESCC